MSGALDKFIDRIRSFLAGPEKESDPLHKMHDLEKEEESEGITRSEGAAITVDRREEA